MNHFTLYRFGKYRPRKYGFIIYRFPAFDNSVKSTFAIALFHYGSKGVEAFGFMEIKTNHFIMEVKFSLCELHTRKWIHH